MKGLISLILFLVCNSAKAEYSTYIRPEQLTDPAFDKALTLIINSDLQRYFLSAKSWPSIIFACAIMFQFTKLLKKYTEAELNFEDIQRTILMSVFVSVLLGHIPFPRHLNINKSQLRQGSFIIVSNIQTEVAELATLIHNAVPTESSVNVNLARLARVAQISQTFCSNNDPEISEKCTNDFIREHSYTSPTGLLLVSKKNLTDAEIKFDEENKCEITRLRTCFTSIFGFAPYIDQAYLAALRTILYMINMFGYIIFFVFVIYNNISSLIILIVLNFTLPLLIIPELTPIVLNTFKTLFKIALFPVIFSLIFMAGNSMLIANYELIISYYANGKISIFGIIFSALISTVAIGIAQILLLLKSSSFAELIFSGATSVDAAGFFNNLKKDFKGVFK